MENLGCNRNGNGDYCLATTYAIFVEQLLLPPAAPHMMLQQYNPVMTGGDDDLTVTFTRAECINITIAAGCCLGSLLNVRVPAGFDFFNFHASVLITEVPIQCPALGVNVSTTPCDNSVVDGCTQFLDTLPDTCQAYALSFPLQVSAAERSRTANTELCTGQCASYMPAILNAITSHQCLFQLISASLSLYIV